MRFSSFVSLAVAGASMAAALPTNLTNFLLVTTSQQEISKNSSELKAVSATSLFVRPLNSPYYAQISNNPSRTPSTNPLSSCA